MQALVVFLVLTVTRVAAWHKIPQLKSYRPGSFEDVDLWPAIVFVIDVSARVAGERASQNFSHPQVKERVFHETRRAFWSVFLPRCYFQTAAQLTRNGERPIKALAQQAYQSQPQNEMLALYNNDQRVYMFLDGFHTGFFSKSASQWTASVPLFDRADVIYFNVHDLPLDKVLVRRVICDHILEPDAVREIRELSRERFLKYILTTRTPASAIPSMTHKPCLDNYLNPPASSGYTFSSLLKLTFEAAYSKCRSTCKNPDTILDCVSRILQRHYPLCQINMLHSDSALYNAYFFGELFVHSALNNRALFRDFLIGLPCPDVPLRLPLPYRLRHLPKHSVLLTLFDNPSTPISMKKWFDKDEKIALVLELPQTSADYVFACSAKAVDLSSLLS